MSFLHASPVAIIIAWQNVSPPATSDGTAFVGSTTANAGGRGDT